MPRTERFRPAHSASRAASRPGARSLGATSASALPGLLALLLGVVAASSPPARAQSRIARVSPWAETMAMEGWGDIADDTCVWVDRRDPRRSLIVGTNKSDDSAGGLYVFRLDGWSVDGERDWTPGVSRFGRGKLNNVDTRSGFVLDGEPVDLVCASNRTDRAIDIFSVVTHADGRFLRLEEVGKVAIGAGFSGGDDAPYGLGMIGTTSTSRAVSVLVSDYDGRVAQYELVELEGQPASRRVGARRHDDGGRPWQLGDGSGPIEGIVADEHHGVVYFASENEGIWRVPLSDGVIAPADKVLVARVELSIDGRGPLAEDVEGLAIWRGIDGSGWLVASSQGQELQGHPNASTYPIFERRFAPGRPNRHVGQLQVVASERIDGVRFTDGVEVCSLDLGAPLEEGALIVHDGEGNTPSNYKVVPWSQVRSAMQRALGERLENEPLPSMRSSPPPVALPVDPGVEDAVGDGLARRLWSSPDGAWWAWLPRADDTSSIYQRAPADGHWSRVARLDPLLTPLPGRADVAAGGDTVVAALHGDDRIGVVALYWSEAEGVWLPAAAPLSWRETSPVTRALVAAAAGGGWLLAIEHEVAGRRRVLLRELDHALTRFVSAPVPVADGLAPPGGLVGLLALGEGRVLVGCWEPVRLALRLLEIERGRVVESSILVGEQLAPPPRFARALDGEVWIASAGAGRSSPPRLWRRDGARWLERSLPSRPGATGLELLLPLARADRGVDLLVASGEQLSLWRSGPPGSTASTLLETDAGIAGLTAPTSTASPRWLVGLEDGRVLELALPSR